MLNSITLFVSFSKTNKFELSTKFRFIFDLFVLIFFINFSEKYSFKTKYKKEKINRIIKKDKIFLIITFFWVVIHLKYAFHFQ